DPTALLERPLPEGPLYVHFDSDIINAEEAPAQNYPVPGGPSSHDLKTVFDHLARSGQVAAVSMTCWTPDLDHDGRSAEICMSTFEALL
ncbi:MAG: arginase family protein, partial [Hyphomicrobiales bacterium]